MLRIIIVILLVVIFIFGIYSFMYINIKDKLESKFNKTIEKYNFSINRDGYYSMVYNDSISFGVLKQEMPELLDFSLD